MPDQHEEPGTIRSGGYARFERRIVWNASAIMFTIALSLMMFEALSRILLSRSHFWVEELSRFLILWAFFLTLGLAGRQGHHIRMTFIVQMLGRRGRLVLSAIGALGGIFFCPILGYGLYRQIDRLIASGIRTESTLDLPMWGVVSVLLVGTVMYFVYYLHCLLLCIRGVDPFGESTEEPDPASPESGPRP